MSDIDRDKSVVLTVQAIIGTTGVFLLLCCLICVWTCRLGTRLRRYLKFPLHRELSPEFFSKGKFKKLDRRIRQNLELELKPPETIHSERNMRSWRDDEFNRKEFIRYSNVILEDVALLGKRPLSIEKNQTIKDFVMMLKDSSQSYSNVWKAYVEKYEMARFSRNPLKEKLFESFLGKFGSLLEELSRDNE